MSVTPQNSNETTKQVVNSSAPCAAQAVPTSTTKSSPEELALKLEPRYPLTVEAFRDMDGGLLHLEYILNLEERWQKIACGENPLENEVLQYAAPSEMPPLESEYDL